MRSGDRRVHFPPLGGRPVAAALQLVGSRVPLPDLISMDMIWEEHRTRYALARPQRIAPKEAGEALGSQTDIFFWHVDASL